MSFLNKILRRETYVISPIPIKLNNSENIQELFKDSDFEVIKIERIGNKPHFISIEKKVKNMFNRSTCDVDFIDENQLVIRVKGKETLAVWFIAFSNLISTPILLFLPNDYWTNAIFVIPTFLISIGIYKLNIKAIEDLSISLIDHFHSKHLTIEKI